MIGSDWPDTEQFFALEDKLEDAIRRSRAGEFDGNEIGGNEYVMYMYGPDADELFRAVEPVLKAFGPAAGSYAMLRRGPADDPKAKQERRPLA